MRRRPLVPALLVGLVLGGWLHARFATPTRLVVDPALPDVAMMTAGREIVLNPRLLLRYPPDLGNYLLRHEQGHVALHHRPVEDPAVRRRQELEADCWAARRARPGERDQAARFFEQAGPFVGPWHPSGTARAREIRRCAP
jgi:hypothetical protein